MTYSPQTSRWPSTGLRRSSTPVRTGVAAALVIGVLLGVTSASDAGQAAAVTTACAESTVTAPARSDAWINALNTSNTGSDAILNVEANPSAGDSRALVRFGLPTVVPAGCVVASARLRMFSSSGTDGARVLASRLASEWSENQVVWSNQPGAVDPAATAWSRDGYLQWDVTTQVDAMLASGVNHGFQLRDFAEGTAEGGAGHGFHSREKGEEPPQLVIRFAAPPSGEPPAPPAAPTPAAVTCGQVLSESTLLTEDLTDCTGDGIVIGASRIIVDLGGHTIDGTGLGTGVVNDGFDTVTVTNGTVQDFDTGVQVGSRSGDNVVEQLALRQNQVAPSSCSTPQQATWSGRTRWTATARGSRW